MMCFEICIKSPRNCDKIYAFFVIGGEKNDIRKFQIKSHQSVIFTKILNPKK